MRPKPHWSADHHAAPPHAALGPTSRFLARVYQDGAGRGLPEPLPAGARTQRLRLWEPGTAPGRDVTQPGPHEALSESTGFKNRYLQPASLFWGLCGGFSLDFKTILLLQFWSQARTGVKPRRTVVTVQRHLRACEHFQGMEPKCLKTLHFL